MWYERETIAYRGRPKKLKGKERDQAVMKIIAQMEKDYALLNEKWGIKLDEGRTKEST